MGREVDANVFRAANETLRERFLAYGVSGPASFICECADDRCLESVSLELGEFQEIRARPRHYAVVPGHEDGCLERVVEARKGVTVVEKLAG